MLSKLRIVVLLSPSLIPFPSAGVQLPEVRRRHRLPVRLQLPRRHRTNQVNVLLQLLVLEGWWCGRGWRRGRRFGGWQRGRWKPECEYPSWRPDGSCRLLHLDAGVRARPQKTNHRQAVDGWRSRGHFLRRASWFLRSTNF